MFLEKSEKREGESVILTESAEGAETSVEINSLAEQLQNSPHEDIRIASDVLLVLSKALEDGNIGEFAKSVVKKDFTFHQITSPQEVLEQNAKMEVVVSINNLIKKLQESTNEDRRTVARVLSTISESLGDGTIPELAGDIFKNVPAVSEKYSHIGVGGVVGVSGDGPDTGFTLQGKPGKFVLEKGTVLADGNVVGAEGNSDHSNLGIVENDIPPPSSKLLPPKPLPQ